MPRIRGLRKLLLDLDARLGHFFFTRSASLRARWAAFSAFMDRFHVAGVKRLAVEGASEGDARHRGPALLRAFRD